MNFLRKKLKALLRNEKNLPDFFYDISRITDLQHFEFEEICRAACQATYLGSDIVLCRVLTKYLMFADAKDVGITPHLCLNGFWETWITKRFAQILQPGWNCVDIGANHGYFSLLMADIAGQTGKVLAVEPNPKLTTLLSQNLEVNGFLSFSSVVPMAVANSVGEKVNLIIPQERALNAAINLNQTVSDECFEVETTTLDELTKNWEHVDFVKIDAEGAEEDIWSGMRETIEKNPQIIVVMEYKNSRYEHPKAFLQNIITSGFALRHIDYDSQVKNLTLEQALTERFDEDWMLYLSRNG